MGKKVEPKSRAGLILYGVAWLIIGVFSILLFTGCANSKLTRFKKDAETMSDAELLNCYYGIHDRIKAIDNGLKRETQLYPAQKSDPFVKQTYFVGGEAYGLMQKEKLLLREINKRNLKP